MRTFFLIVLALVFSNCYSQLDENTKAKLYFIEAEKQFNQNNYSQVIEYLEKAEVELGNSNARILNLKIKSYYNDGKFKKAESALNTFINEHQSSATEEIKNETLGYFVRIEKAAFEQNKEEVRRKEILDKKLKRNKLWDELKQISKENFIAYGNNIYSKNLQKLKLSFKNSKIYRKSEGYFYENGLKIIYETSRVLDINDVKEVGVSETNGITVISLISYNKDVEETVYAKVYKNGDFVDSQSKTLSLPETGIVFRKYISDTSKNDLKRKLEEFVKISKELN